MLISVPANLELGPGAQENICEIRADNFSPTGGRIDVLDVQSNYNHVNLIEEIGARAATQYTVRLGPSAAYNAIQFSTQQAVTGVLDSTGVPIGKRAKNLIRQVGPGLIDAPAGEVICVECWSTSPGGLIQSELKCWVAPALCVLIRAVAWVKKNKDDEARVYFAKNRGYSTKNRVTFPKNHHGSQSIVIDRYASIDIDPQWVFEEGDILSFAMDTGIHGDATVAATALLRFI